MKALDYERYNNINCITLQKIMKELGLSWKKIAHEFTMCCKK